MIIQLGAKNPKSSGGVGGGLKSDDSIKGAGGLSLLHNHDLPSVRTKEPLQAASRIIHQTIHQGQSILQSSITGILDSLRNRSGPTTTSTTTGFQFPPGIGTWGSGPQFVVAERVFRRDPREDVIRWRRLHGSLYKFGKAELHGGNT